MHCCACFHADEAPLQLLNKRDHLLAAKLSDNNLIAFIDAMNIKDILGEIKTDGLNLHVDAPLKGSAAAVILTQQIGRGADFVHRIKSGI